MAIHLTTEGVPFLDILVSTVTLSEDHGITGVNVLLKYHPLQVTVILYTKRTWTLNPDQRPY